MPITTSGTTPNNFLYSSEQFDNTLGLYYLRARYYDSATGRFETADPIEGTLQYPLTLHLYAYTGNNPITWLDPNGEAAIAEYAFLRKINRGLDLEAHHIIEKRFAPVFLAGACTLAVALTRSEHQPFTNAWRQQIPYGAGTANATPTQIWTAAELIYANFPDILDALQECKANFGF